MLDTKSTYTVSTYRVPLKAHHNYYSDPTCKHNLPPPSATISVIYNLYRTETPTIFISANKRLTN